MSSDSERPDLRFEPLRPASRKRLLVGIVLGPLLWAVALVIVARTLRYTWAIEIGLAIAAASFLVASVMLALLRALRLRQEKRYAARS